MTPRLRPVDRRILSLALPALGSLAVEPLYVLTDTAIIGRVGTEELAGLAVAASVLSIVFAGSNFITYGSTEQVARRHGAQDDAGAANVAVQTMWLAGVVGVMAAAAVALLARQLASLFGATGEVLDHADTYLTISALGIPFLLLTLGAQGVLRGESDYTTPLWVLLGSNIANVIIELGLVFGLDLGVAGSAWSTVLSQCGAALVFALIVKRRLALSTYRRPSWARAAPLLNAGRHLLLRVGSMLVVTTGATAVAARIDEQTLAAHQIATSLFMFIALALDALAVPAHTIVAEHLGGDDRAGASFVARRCVVLSMWCGVGLAAVLAVSAPALPRVFTPDPSVIDPTGTAILWLAVITLPGALAFAYDGVLIGAGDYRFLGLAAFGYTIAVAPIGLYAVERPAVGISGIWAGLAVWMVLRAAVNHWRTAQILPRPATRG